MIFIYFIIFPLEKMTSIYDIQEAVRRDRSFYFFSENTKPTINTALGRSHMWLCKLSIPYTLEMFFPESFPLLRTVGKHLIVGTKAKH